MFAWKSFILLVDDEKWWWKNVIFAKCVQKSPPPQKKINWAWRTQKNTKNLSQNPLHQVASPDILVRNNLA